ncbi:hypothetical protein BLA29_011960 [Euroglyphus maynei]|uniref:Uncharacterized protein n=1 Tax=Euroglyphus maynei TaxID=6958 RepID=A0A1Y3BHE9_EURMA|nr:hypothetical protein BLA29_011960 [Euroglyphus maynei]
MWPNVIPNNDNIIR